MANIETMCPRHPGRSPFNINSGILLTRKDHIIIIYNIEPLGLPSLAFRPDAINRLFITSIPPSADDDHPRLSPRPRRYNSHITVYNNNNNICDCYYYGNYTRRTTSASPAGCKYRHGHHPRPRPSPREPCNIVIILAI